MAAYLSLVNDVLARLRETEVASISSSPYSVLVSKYVNDVKRQVENAWNWEALITTLTLTTVGGTSEYTLTGSGTRHKGISVNNTTDTYPLQNKPLAYIRHLQQIGTTTDSQPRYYAWSGSNGTDSKVTLWPTPNAVDSIKFNMYVPQVDLSADGDILLVPDDAVILGAYARALVERGEDGGLTSGEAYGLYRGLLGDLISLEANRSADMDWIAV